MIVSISAIYITDLRHSSSLKDARCKDAYIVPYDSDTPLDQSIESFDNAVYGNIRDMTLRVFEVKATGRFDWDQTTKRGKFTFDKVIEFQRTTLDESGLGANNSFKPNPLRGSA